MKGFWDKTAWLYDISQLTNSQANDQMAKAVENEISEGDLVLDCAAGTGILTMAAAKKARRVICTDMSRKMLAEAMKKSRRMGLYNIGFARRDITSLGDRDGKYDAVIAGNVIHLLDEPQKAFKELVRVTKSGGKIIIPTYLQADSGVFGLVIKLYRLPGADFSKSFSIDEYLDFIAKNAEENGCEEYSVRYIHGNIPVGFAVLKK